MSKKQEEQTSDEWLTGCEDSFSPTEFEGVMADFSEGRETEAQKWARLDSIAKHKLSNEADTAKIMAWFEVQDEKWKTSRLNRLSARVAGLKG